MYLFTVITTHTCKCNHSCSKVSLSLVNHTHAEVQHSARVPTILQSRGSLSYEGRLSNLKLPGVHGSASRLQDRDTFFRHVTSHGVARLSTVNPLKAIKISCCLRERGGLRPVGLLFEDSFGCLKDVVVLTAANDLCHSTSLLVNKNTACRAQVRSFANAGVSEVYLCVFESWSHVNCLSWHQRLLHCCMNDNCCLRITIDLTHAHDFTLKISRLTWTDRWISDRVSGCIPH